MAVFRGFRGYFEANSGSAMANKKYLFHSVSSLSLGVL